MKTLLLSTIDTYLRELKLTDLHALAPGYCVGIYEGEQTIIKIKDA